MFSMMKISQVSSILDHLEIYSMFWQYCKQYGNYVRSLSFRAAVYCDFLTRKYACTQYAILSPPSCAKRIHETKEEDQ